MLISNDTLSSASFETRSTLISTAQVEQFHRGGWCVVDSLFSNEEVDAIQELDFNSILFILLSGLIFFSQRLGSLFPV